MRKRTKIFSIVTGLVMLLMTTPIASAQFTPAIAASDQDVVDGTVYTILVRLEKNKLVDIEKSPSEMGPPRKFFTLNRAGQQELRKFWEKWKFISSRIDELKEKSE